MHVKLADQPVTAAVMGKVVEGLGKETRDLLWRELRADYALMTERQNYLAARLRRIEEALGLPPLPGKPD